MAHECDRSQGIECHDREYIEKPENSGTSSDKDDGADRRHIVLTDLQHKLAGPYLP